MPLANDTLKKSPQLRFREFKNDWGKKKLSDLLRLDLREVPKPESLYLALGIRSHFKGTFRKPDSDPAKIAMKSLYVVKEGDLIVNITFAWEGAVAITSKEDENGFVSHRFPTFRFVDAEVNGRFFRYIFPTKRFKYDLIVASPGGAGRNRVLNRHEFLEIVVYIPELSEQTKIADFLTAVDDKIDLLQSKVDLLKNYKNGVLQTIFNQKVRFKNDFGKMYSDWVNQTLGEILEYEQPTKYIVESTEYSRKYTTPVLTAGKTFILGYTNEEKGVFKTRLPVIIFDDFTTASQFVDFPFKVKSSAMKILKPKNNINIKVAYELLNRIHFNAKEHKRYWIGEYQNFVVKVPQKEEQQKIAAFLTVLDDKINLSEKKLEQAKRFKNVLLQQMFI